MINEANDHPRYAVDVQRDQSKPGHPHATVYIKYTSCMEKSKLETAKKAKTASRDDRKSKRNGQRGDVL